MIAEWTISVFKNATGKAVTHNITLSQMCDLVYTYFQLIDGPIDNGGRTKMLLIQLTHFTAQLLAFS